MKLARASRRPPGRMVITLNPLIAERSWMAGLHRLVLFSGIALAIVAGQPGALSAQKPAQPQSAASSTSGWQHIVRDGCQFEVPTSWRPAPDGDGLKAPNGSSLTVRAVQILNWSAHKEQIREAFVHLKTVHEDSDHRFWFEIGS